MKIFFKKLLVILMIFTVLLPSLFSNMCFADSNVNLTIERAGNYVANFAINFYENWSSVNVEKQGSINSTGNATASGEYSFTWPIEEKSVTSMSEFGPRSLDGQHKGMDLAAPMGTPVYSSCDGVVKQVFNNCPHNYGKDKNEGSCGCGGNYGNNVKIDSGNGVAVIYGHLTDTMVKEGDTVKQGQQIGTVGSTGWSTGYHLHFEFITNNIEGLSSDQYIARSTLFGYSYSVNPRVYVEDGATISPVSFESQKSSYTLRGEIKTIYDETATADINPSDEQYKISNKSWINFVYKNSLTLDDSSLPINIDTLNTNSYSKIETVKTGEMEDIYKLLNTGKILPGDILIATRDGGQTQEYLLYVGGTKIIYATPKLAEGAGALEYEYLQYYLKDIKDELKEKYRKNEEQKYEDIEIPINYGISAVYRIGGNLVLDEYFTNICEDKANLIFNGKGYYNPDIEYIGIPTDIAYEGSTNLSFFRWLIDALIRIVKLLLNLVLYAFRIVIVGWTSLIESIIQSMVLSVGGSAETKGTAIDKATGFSAITAIEDRVSIESIFFNEVPILDANFFDLKNAGKYSLLVEKNGEMVPDTSNVVYVLRKNLAEIYYIVRNLSIAILLFVLIYLGIRMALTSIAEKKAEYKKLLVSWVIAFIIVMFIHLLMYVVLNINEVIINICRDISISSGTELVDGIGEMSLYEAVRTKAYSFSFTDGTIGMIFYIVMVYLLVRFLLIYFKRYITIYILALSGSFMGVKYAIDKISGKKTTSLGKWIKEFSFNVLLQSVHAFIYSVFMGVALSTAETSFAGLIYSFVILNVMVHSDKIFMKIFGIDKASSLADVNTLSNPWEIIYRFKPMWTMATTLFGGVKNATVGKNGAITAIRLAGTGKDNIKDARKELLKIKYEKTGSRYRKVEEKFSGFMMKNEGKVGSVIPIKLMNAIMNTDGFRHKRLLGNHISADTNKAILKNLDKVKKIKKQRFTRGISTGVGLGYGLGMRAASIGQLAEDPKMGLLTNLKGRGKINGYASKGKYTVAEDEFYKMRTEKLKSKYKETEKKYNSFKTKYDEESEEYKDKNRKKLKKLEKEVNDAKMAYDYAKAGVGTRKEKELKINAINRNYLNAQAKDEKDLGKAEKMLTGYEQIVEEESRLNKLMAKLKDKTKEIAQENGVSIEDAQKEMRRQLNITLSQSKKANIGSGAIKASIAEYFYNNNTTKIESDDINGVLDILEKRVNESNKKNGRPPVKFTDDTRKIIKEQIESNVGGSAMEEGLSRKDAAVNIALALSNKEILEPKSINKIQNEELREIYREISQKVRKIDTLNQVSSMQNKQQLVGRGKVIKNARKKSKEV